MRKTIIILNILFCTTNIAAQKISPNKLAVIDTIRRAQYKQIIDEIDTMQLKCDTIGDVASNWFRGIYFDNKGRLRKYFWKNSGSGDGANEGITISAYYNKNGELIYLSNETSTNCDAEEEFYYIDKGCIVDFAMNYDCGCCEGGEEGYTKKEINRIRSRLIGNLLKVSISWELNLTNFIHTGTLLKILQGEKYYDMEEFGELQ